MASAIARCFLPPCFYSRTPCVFCPGAFALALFFNFARCLHIDTIYCMVAGERSLFTRLSTRETFRIQLLSKTLPLAFPRNFFVVPSLFTSFSIDRTRVVVDELADVVVVVVERRLWSVHLCTTLHLRREPILVFSVRTPARFAASWRTSSAIMSIFSTSAAARNFRSTARCSWRLPIA